MPGLIQTTSLTHLHCNRTLEVMKFEWDPEKNRANQSKHGVSFEDAVRVFDADEEALELFDEGHSDFEDRFITIGPIEDGLALVV